MAIWVTRMYHLPSERPEVVLPMLALDDDDGLDCMYESNPSFCISASMWKLMSVGISSRSGSSLLRYRTTCRMHYQKLEISGEGQFFVRVENTLS